MAVKGTRDAVRKALIAAAFSGFDPYNSVDAQSRWFRRIWAQPGA